MTIEREATRVVNDYSAPSARRASVAATLAPLFDRLFPDGPPVGFSFWDESTLGPEGANRIAFTKKEAMAQLLWSPDELGLARGFVTGDIELHGDLFASLHALAGAGRALRGKTRRLFARELIVAARLGCLARPDIPPEEVRLRGAMHSKRRDAAAITHHYDVSNELYRLVLGSSMTYSCARFSDATMDLGDAQSAKHELICQKLGLGEGQKRLLDVGCGWGSMAIHAASRFGANVVGITLSKEQQRLARERVREHGLEHLVEIRLQDYRDVRNETFDAISSIGMFEHVGSQRMHEYFTTLRALLSPRGRMLNHAISTPGGSALKGRTFIARYVFPDGELIDVADVARAMERTGFEVRDVESLREHYAKTLRAWVANLESSFDQAVEHVGEARARIWLLYMAASAVSFENGRLAVHQVLGVVPARDGSSGMPATRKAWEDS